MKITAIKQQVKQPDRASVFVDSKYSFSLNLNELLNEKLKVGLELDEVSLKRLKKLSADGKLKMRALEWALNRPRSVRELREYFYRKKAEPEHISHLTQEFIRKGYVSDENYARWLIDVRRRRGKSERAIRSELFSKGVAHELADEALAEGGNELDRLRQLVEKKCHLPRYKADAQKLMHYLARQGFSFDDIKQVLKENELV